MPRTSLNATKTPETLTVLYDGACPLCRREIAHVRGLADRAGDTALCFVDISSDSAHLPADERSRLLARFHVQRPDGSLLDGASAFVAMWARLPGWRWLARAARLPGALAVLEMAYRVFLSLRPSLQAAVRRLDGTASAPSRAATATLSDHLERELRSDHAGETGAVCIYRGITDVSRWRGNADLIAFASRHGSTESEHLRLIETWLPPSRRSRLLGAWRIAGWLTGALPALFGERAVYATIAAVETFVNRHYQQQIDYLLQQGGPEDLLALLRRCQAEECEHRDEAAALAGAVKSPALRLWCTMVEAGSGAAVTLARRL